jgi:hypothetical protein
MNVVRISIGRFDPENLESVRSAFKVSQEKLVPGIKSMPGNLSYYAGIDGENHAMVNVSSWESVTSAKQMERFQPMLDLARLFIEMGVRFDRPIFNFEPVWTIERD